MTRVEISDLNMTAKEFITNFDILLFDMGKTFMFRGDRFDEEQEYEKTYISFGGKKLSNKILHEIIYYIYGKLLIRSRDEKFQDDMMTVEELIENDEYFKDITNEDKILIEKVFAYHECGVVPISCKETLGNLSNSHKLGLISNVWCKSEYFKKQLKKDEVFDLFEITIFSSDHKSVKPSKKIFNKAIEHFGTLPHKMVYIGDNYKRDVIGSKNAGMKSILVNNSDSSKISGNIKPDYIIHKIEELV